MNLPRMTMLLPLALAAAGAAVPAQATTAERARANPAYHEWLTAKHCIQYSKAEALHHVGFRNADKNGDGYVDMHEAIEAGVWTDVPNSYPDFRISRKEWRETEANPQRVSSADCVKYSKAEALRRVGFDRADRNGDGYVDMQEALKAGVWTDVPNSYPDFRISREEWLGVTGNVGASG